MQLAHTHPDLQIIGLGGQDDLDQAAGFVTRTETGSGIIDIVWDPSFDAWRSFGVRSQPYWILYGADGEIAVSRPGAIDFELVESILG